MRTVDKTIAHTEYAVEINNDKGFVRQIDVFDNYEEACAFVDKNSVQLTSDEYFNVIFIDYNGDGDEVGFGTVC